MRNFNFFSASIVFAFLAISFSSCKKSDSGSINNGLGITLTTSPITNISGTSAIGGGNITSDGGSPILARGVCWGTNPSPSTSDFLSSDGSGSGVFVSSITNLVSGVTYYVRAYATNSKGTAYGNIVSFIAGNSGGGGGGGGSCAGGPSTVTDVDGNVYNVVTIGNQCWTKENLKTTKYRNGNSIATNLTDAQWTNTSSGAWSYYGNNIQNNNTYGKLYNYYAVADPRGLCPLGWHVPTDNEWNQLVIFLDQQADTSEFSFVQSISAGGDLKAVSNLWTGTNVGATNSSGFSGLPGGSREFNGGYDMIGLAGAWWTSSLFDNVGAWSRTLYDFDSSVYRDEIDLTQGFSVRCVRD